MQIRKKIVIKGENIQFKSFSVYYFNDITKFINKTFLLSREIARYGKLLSYI